MKKTPNIIDAYYKSLGTKIFRDTTALPFADGGPLNDRNIHGDLLPSVYASALGRYYGNGGMLKRADGSYSKRGLWDNIRDNAGSGKEPNKEMLSQERKINNSYAEGGNLTSEGLGDPILTPAQQKYIADKKAEADRIMQAAKNGDINYKQYAAEFKNKYNENFSCPSNNCPPAEYFENTDKLPYYIPEKIEIPNKDLIIPDEDPNKPEMPEYYPADYTGTGIHGVYSHGHKTRKTIVGLQPGNRGSIDHKIITGYKSIPTTHFEGFDTHYDRTKLIPSIVQKATGYNPDFMEGYETEVGNSIPGEYQNAEEEGRRINFSGASSLRDLKSQKEYNAAFDEYEKYQKMAELYKQSAGNMFIPTKQYSEGGQMKPDYSLPEDSFQQGGRGLKNSVYASSMGQYPAPYDMGGAMNQYPDGGPIYTYAKRPGSYYQKDENGQWLISNKGTGGQYVPVEDPSGQRTAALNKGAVVTMQNPTADKYSNVAPSYGKSPMVQSVAGRTEAERQPVQNEIAGQQFAQNMERDYAQATKDQLPQHEQPATPQDWIWTLPMMGGSAMKSAGTAIADGIGTLGTKVAPYITGALETSIPGMASVPGATVGNAVAAGFAADAAVNRLPEIPGQISRGEYTDAVANALTGAIDVAGAGVMSPLYQGAKSTASELGKLLNTEDGLLSNAYKVNPFAFKPNPNAYYRGIGEAGMNDALNTGVLRSNRTGTGLTNNTTYDAVFFDKGKTRLADALGNGNIAEVRDVPMKEFSPNHMGVAAFDESTGKFLNEIPLGDNTRLLKQDWLKGYKEVNKEIIPEYASNNVSQNSVGTKIADKFFPNTKQLVKEIKARDVSTEPLREAEQWTKEWINHPATQKKIATSYNNADYGPADIEGLSKMSLPDRMAAKDAYSDNLKLGYEQVANYDPTGKLNYYPINKQLTQHFLMPGAGNIHTGNSGVSYTHLQSPSGLKSPELMHRAEFQNPTHNRTGNWISRVAPDKISTGVHELTHDWAKDFPLDYLGQKQMINDNIGANVTGFKTNIQTKLDEAVKAKDKKEIKRLTDLSEDLDYMSNPTEVHARIMELRKHQGIKPGDFISNSQGEKILSSISAGNTPVDTRFAQILGNNKSTANIFNNAWMTIPALSAGALLDASNSTETNSNARGGFINQYPDGGVLGAASNLVPTTPVPEGPVIPGEQDVRDFYTNWYSKRTLPFDEIGNKQYEKTMKSILPAYNPESTLLNEINANKLPYEVVPTLGDGNSEGAIVYNKKGVPEKIQLSESIMNNPRELNATMMHEEHTRIMDPYSDKVYPAEQKIIEPSIKSFDEIGKDIKDSEKRDAAGNYYDYLTSPQEDNIQSMLFEIRQQKNLQPDQVITDEDIENWKLEGEKSGELDKNSPNFNGALYNLFKVSKDNSSMKNLFNYIASDNTPKSNNMNMFPTYGGNFV